MLTSSANQYLRPEYLTPLPTTLDAKKSPLALLAQTCSQIGVDPPSSKSLLALDKSSKSSKSSSDSSSRDKSSPSSHTTSTSLSSSSAASSSSFSSVSETSKSSSFKPYESCVSRDKATSSPEQPRVPSAHSNSGSNNSRSRTPANGSSSSSRRCSSNQSASSSSGGGRAITPQGRKSLTPGSDVHRDSPNQARAPSGGEPRSGSTHSPANLPAKSAQYSPLSLTSSQEQFSQAGFRPSGLSLSTAASVGATTTTTPSAAAYGLPYPPQLPPMDAMTASSLMSQHHAALKNGLAGNPYLGYARMKTPSGADTLVPVCRDPFCTGCPLSSHLLAASSGATSPAAGAKLPSTSSPAPGQPCPAGCAQCDHKQSQHPQQSQPAVSVASAAAAAAAAAAASSPYAAYAAHAQLIALASQLPYACSWIGSDATYCGKRFASTDELVQHYRSHTGSAPGSAEASAAAAAANTAAALSLLTPPGLAPGHPLLSRSYPTPPLSPLTSARYHPYSKPYGAPPLSSLGLPLPPPHPHAAGLPPYFSPYSLYAAGSRLGAATGMHP